MFCPIISVIVPVYNAEKYLNRCLNSILNQKYKNLEIILIDDGSTDKSGYICDKYQNLDSRIKVIHKKNEGAALTRNCGIDNAKGDYIAFVDSDDFIDENMYSEMMKINDKYHCEVVMCDCYKESDNYKKIFTHNIRTGYYSKDKLYEEYFSKLLMTDSVDYPPTISNCTCLICKELIDKYHIRYEDVRFSEDLLFGSQIMYYTNSFYYMKNIALYHYIFNSNSVSNSFCKDKWPQLYKLYNLCVDFFSTKNDYDFSYQINMLLLFIVYHCIGNITNSNMDFQYKKIEINRILDNSDVQLMFKSLRVFSLNISFKLKLKTYFYKKKYLRWILLYI